MLGGSPLLRGIFQPCGVHSYFDLYLYPNGVHPYCEVHQPLPFSLVEYVPTAGYVYFILVCSLAVDNIHILLLFVLHSRSYIDNTQSSPTDNDMKPIAWCVLSNLHIYPYYLKGAEQCSQNPTHQPLMPYVPHMSTTTDPIVGAGKERRTLVGPYRVTT